MPILHPGMQTGSPGFAAWSPPDDSPLPVSESWTCAACDVRGLHSTDPVCWYCNSPLHLSSRPSC